VDAEEEGITGRVRYGNEREGGRGGNPAGASSGRPRERNVANSAADGGAAGERARRPRGNSKQQAGAGATTRAEDGMIGKDRASQDYAPSKPGDRVVLGEEGADVGDRRAAAKCEPIRGAVGRVEGVGPHRMKGTLQDG
jgi:hypothetical protein